MALSHALAFVRASVKRWQGSCGLGYGAAKRYVVGVPTLSQEAEGHVCGGAIASRRGTLRGQRAWARTEISMRENREVPWSPAGRCLMPRPGWFAGWCSGLVGREGNAMAVSPQ